MMSIIASEDPAAFAKEDLRLIRGKVTPEEYGKLVRIQQGFGEESPAVAAFSLGRFSKLLSGPSTSETGFTPLVREASFVPDQKTAFPSSGQPARESETLLPSEMDIGGINARSHTGQPQAAGARTRSRRDKHKSSQRRQGQTSNRRPKENGQPGGYRRNIFARIAERANR